MQNRDSLSGRRRTRRVLDAQKRADCALHLLPLVPEGKERRAELAGKLARKNADRELRRANRGGALREHWPLHSTFPMQFFIAGYTANSLPIPSHRREKKKLLRTTIRKSGPLNRIDSGKPRGKCEVAKYFGEGKPLNVLLVLRLPRKFAEMSPSVLTMLFTAFRA